MLSCPVGFTAKVGSNVECTKPSPLAITNGQMCPEGYEEWVSNFCFVTCPAPLLNNGFSCFKPTLTRDYVPLPSECKNLFLTASLSGCKLSAIGICLILLLAIGIGWILWMIYTHFIKQTKKEPVDTVLNQIDAYFKRK
jgi:hypothetical protein